MTAHVWRTLTGLGLALIVFGGTLMGIGSAEADTNASGHGPGQYVSWPAYSGFWLGTYQTSNGLAICVTPSGDSPVERGGSDPYSISPGWVNDEGVAASAEQLAEVAYILWWMGPDPSDYAAGMARLAAFTVLGYDSVNVYGSQRLYNFDVFSPGSDGQEIAGKLGMLADVQSLVGEAKARANIWDGSSAKMVSNIDQISTPGDTITASVTFPGLVSGYEVTFTVTKPDGSVKDVQAVTDANGTAHVSYKTSPTVQGTYRVDYSISDVPPSVPVAYSPGGPNPQDMFFAAPPARGVRGSVPGVTLRFPPTVGTQVSAATVTAGDVLTDTVKSGNLDPSLSWSLTGVLNGPIPAVDGSCTSVEWAKAPVALRFTSDIAHSGIDADGTSTLTGLGSWQVPLAHDDMCVSYSEHVSGKDSSGKVVSEADHPVGSAGQTAVVEKRVPALSSAVSDTGPHPGDTVTDSVKISNVVLDAAGVTYKWTYHGSLYGPVPPGGSWDTAPVVQTWSKTLASTDVGSDRTVALAGVGGFTIPMNKPAGCYSYAATVDVLGSDGSTYHVSHPAGDPKQTTCVPQSLITIATQISSQSSKPADTITDHFSAGGLIGAMGGNPVSWAVHVTLASAGLDADGQCAQADWKDAEAVQEAELAISPDWIAPDGTVDVNGVGGYTIPEGDSARCLTYGETLKGTWSGGEVSITHPLGQESQTTLVAPSPVPVVPAPVLPASPVPVPASPVPVPAISVTTGGSAVLPHRSGWYSWIEPILPAVGAIARFVGGGAR